MNAGVFPRPVSWGSVLAGLAMVLLAGCATHQGASTDAGNSNVSAGKTDLVTDSDEPEVRRRARLRLELASGYFEAGQTTVALDEVKQALAADPTFVSAWNLRGLVLGEPRSDGLRQIGKHSCRIELEGSANAGGQRSHENCIGQLIDASGLKSFELLDRYFQRYRQRGDVHASRLPCGAQHFARNHRRRPDHQGPPLHCSVLGSALPPVRSITDPVT